MECLNVWISSGNQGETKGFWISGSKKESANNVPANSASRLYWLHCVPRIVALITCMQIQAYMRLHKPWPMLPIVTQKSCILIFFKFFTCGVSSFPMKHAKIISIFFTMKATILDTLGSNNCKRRKQYNLNIKLR